MSDPTHPSGLGSAPKTANASTCSGVNTPIDQRRKPRQTYVEMPDGVILLAEDCEDEVLLIRRAFAEARFLNPLHVVSDGDEVIAYLKGDRKYANREEYPLPGLLLLDLKMPRK